MDLSGEFSEDMLLYLASFVGNRTFVALSSLSRGYRQTLTGAFHRAIGGLDALPFRPARFTNVTAATWRVKAIKLGRQESMGADGGHAHRATSDIARL